VFLLLVVTILVGGIQASLYDISQDLLGEPISRYSFLPSQDASFDAEGDRLVYSSEEGFTGGLDVFIVDRDGGNLRYLTDLSGNEHGPVFDARGDNVVFIQDGKSIMVVSTTNGSTLLLHSAVDGTIIEDVQVALDDSAVVATFVHEDVPPSRDIGILRSTNGSLWSGPFEFSWLTRDRFHQRDIAVSMNGTSIYYSSDEDGGDFLDIYVMDIHTGVRERLTNIYLDQTNPIPARDEGEVYYLVSDVAEGSQIFHLDEEGTATRVIKTRGDITPSSGRRDMLLVTQNVDSSFPRALGITLDRTIWRYTDRVEQISVAADTGDILVMLPSSEIILVSSDLHWSEEVSIDIDYSGHPVLSPDGTFIAFSDTSNEITLVDVNTGSLTRTGVNATLRWPSFSSDGKRIIFSEIERDGSYDLSVIDLDSGSKSRVFRTPYNTIMPRFSPDGSSLVFSSDMDGASFFDVWTYHLGSGRIEQVTHENHNQMHPTYTPDGTGVVFTSSHPNGYDFYLAYAGAEGERPIHTPNNPWILFTQFIPSTDSMVFLEWNGIISIDLDEDGDGVSTFTDMFPGDREEWFDLDLDGWGDNGDPDDDGDGVDDLLDSFPRDPTESHDTDGDGIGDRRDDDDDSDGWTDDMELLVGSDPHDLSSWPTDFDYDGIPDIFDDDDDDDGAPDVVDAYPRNPSEQKDTDHDGLGDLYDPDDDDDGILDIDEPAYYSRYSTGENKTILFSEDPSEWSDVDGDGIGDISDLDDDDDGSTDEDTDRDGLGDPVDPDIDNDGIINEEDDYPLDSSRHTRPQGTLVMGDVEIAPGTWGAALASVAVAMFALYYGVIRLRMIIYRINWTMTLADLSGIEERVRVLNGKGRLSYPHLLLIQRAISRRALFLQHTSGRKDGHTDDGSYDGYLIPLHADPDVWGISGTPVKLEKGISATYTGNSVKEALEHGLDDGRYLDRLEENAFLRRLMILRNLLFPRSYPKGEGSAVFAQALERCEICSKVVDSFEYTDQPVDLKLEGLYSYVRYDSLIDSRVIHTRSDRKGGLPPTEEPDPGPFMFPHHIILSIMGVIGVISPLLLGDVILIPLSFLSILALTRVLPIHFLFHSERTLRHRLPALKMSVEVRSTWRWHYDLENEDGHPSMMRSRIFRIFFWSMVIWSISLMVMLDWNVDDASLNMIILILCIATFGFLFHYTANGIREFYRLINVKLAIPLSWWFFVIPFIVSVFLLIPFTGAIADMIYHGKGSILLFFIPLSIALINRYFSSIRDALMFRTWADIKGMKERTLTMSRPHLRVALNHIIRSSWLLSLFSAVVIIEIVQGGDLDVYYHVVLLVTALITYRLMQLADIARLGRSYILPSTRTKTIDKDLRIRRPLAELVNKGKSLVFVLILLTTMFVSAMYSPSDDFFIFIYFMVISMITLTALIVMELDFFTRLSDFLNEFRRIKMKIIGPTIQNGSTDDPVHNRAAIELDPGPGDDHMERPKEGFLLRYDDE